VTREEIQKWLEWVLITSIPLRRIGGDGAPIGIASGCLADYRGRRFLLSVSHAVKMGSADWVIELGAEAKGGTEIYRPANFLYLGEITRGEGKFTQVDYCYAEVRADLESTFQHMTPRGPQSDRIPRCIFDLDALGEPDVNELYGFSGQVHPEMHGTIALVTQPTVYPGLRYTKSDGPFHEFKLPVPHPGHAAFSGCSGAPIVDTNGRLVALVSWGDETEDTIYGIALSRYKFAIDFYCNTIRPSQVEMRT
jgi:hypothetical protein